MSNASWIDQDSSNGYFVKRKCHMGFLFSMASSSPRRKQYNNRAWSQSGGRTRTRGVGIAWRRNGW